MCECFSFSFPRILLKVISGVAVNHCLIIAQNDPDQQARPHWQYSQTTSTTVPQYESLGLEHLLGWRACFMYGVTEALQKETRVIHTEALGVQIGIQLTSQSYQEGFHSSSSASRGGTSRLT